MNCNKCGTENKEGATFCKKCGNSLIPDHICKKCGTENDVDAAFCEKCGEKMKSAKQDIGEAVAKAGKAVKEKSVELGAIVADKTEAVTKQLAENKPTFTAQAQKLTTQANEAVATVQRKTGLNKYIIMGVAALLVVAIVVVAVLPLFSAAKSVEIEGSYQYGMIPIKQGDKYGFMDTKGNIAVPCIYDEVMPFENGKAQGKLDGGWQEITSEFAREYEPKMYSEDELYLFADLFPEGLAPVAKKDSNGDEKHGFMDKTGKEVIPLIYDYSAESFAEGLALVRKEYSYGDYKCGYIDKTGKEVIPFIYDGAESFAEGLAVVGKYDSNGVGKCGFVDKTGKEVIPLDYDDAESFTEGLALVEKRDSNGDEKYGYIDKTGKEVTPFIYDGAESFTEGFAPVAKMDSNGDYKYGYIDNTGKEVTPFIYDGAEPFAEGLALVEKRDSNGKRKYGYIDNTGKEVTSFIYDGTEPFTEGLALVEKMDSYGYSKYGYIDKTGKEVTPFIYDGAGPFAEGLALVAKRDSNGDYKYGYIDKTGKEVIPLIYNSAGRFTEGLAPVAKKDSNGDEKHGFMDKTGKEVIPLIYNRAGIFTEGIAFVEKKDSNGKRKYGYIDKTGKEVIPLIYDDGYRIAVMPPINVYLNGRSFIDELRVAAVKNVLYREFGYIILNPIKSYTNPDAIPLGQGVFGVKSGAIYSQLENELGEKLVAFDKSLNKCAKLFADGIKQLNNGNADKAKSTLIKALELQPENIHIMSALEKACTQAGDMAKATDYRSQINALSGVKSIDEKRAAAKKAYEDSDIATAYVLYTEILQEAPDDEQTYSDLAQLCISQEKYKNAAEILQIGIAATGSDTLKAVLEDIQLKADFGGETGQMLTDGLKIAERIAETTGDSDKLELGKELYSILRNLQ